MKSFMYIARDSLGVRKEGFKQSASTNEAVGWLREQNFTPISVKEVSAAAKRRRRAFRSKRVKSADVAALCWQLTTMIEGGVSVTTALETIGEDMENLRLQQIMRQILERMQKGETFSSSIAEFPDIFNRLCCAIILAGETSGNLPAALRRMAEYFDSRDKLAKKVKGAMAYPAFIFGFIVLVVVFIMAFIIPRFRAIFDQIGGELPAFTRMFMGFYDALRHNLFYVITVPLLVVISSVLIRSKTQKGHYLFSRMALAIPLLGRVFAQGFIAMFCKTMATLLGAGVSVLDVFDILATMTSNDVINGAIVRTRAHIVEGSNISAGLAASGFFPNMVVKMIQVGEESGSLSRVLDRTAEYYERKVDSTITTVLGLLEPIMIVAVGGIVSVVVIALYLPIFSMSEL